MAATTKRRPSVAAKGAMKGFGTRLRELREARELSQRELAELIDIEVMQINRYERGLNLPSVDTTVKLARVLRITTDELLMGAQGEVKPPDIRNLKLYERFSRLDKLPKAEQEMAMSVLDGVIARYELNRLAGQMLPAVTSEP